MMSARLKHLLSGSLRRQLMTGMMLIVALMMVLFVWDLTRRQQAVALEEQIERVVAIAHGMTASSAVWVASRDYSGLDEIVHGMSYYPDLQYVMLLDARGEILAHSDATRRGQYLTDLPKDFELKVLQSGIRLVDIASPITLNDRPIGWVRIAVAGTSLQARLADIQRSGIYYTLITLVLSAFFVWLTSSFLTRKLSHMAQVARGVQAGQTGLRAEVSGDDEAAQLAHQLNTMLDTLAQRDQALKASEAFKNVILDCVAAEVAVIDGDGVILAVNAHWQQFALSNSDVPGHPTRHTDVGTNYLQVCQAAGDTGSQSARAAHEGIVAVIGGHLPRFILEYPCHAPLRQRWFTMAVMPLGTAAQRGVVITHTDITLLKQTELHEQFRSRILELMAADIPLHEVLKATVLGVEQLHPAMLCSILLLDAAGLHLGHGVAPSLPDFYNAAIEGIQIGQGVGSCGTAAFTRERVIVADIATHPYWADYKALAQRAGLGACWSEPIMSSAGQLLGTFAIYHRQAHMPSKQDIVVIEQSARLAGIAIEKKQTQDALRTSEDTFRTLFETVSHGVVYRDSSGQIISANPAAQRILGLDLAQLQERTPHDPDWKLVDEDHHEITLDQLPGMQTLRSGQPVKNRLIGVLAPGRPDVWIRASATPLFEEGRLTKVYTIFEDETERYMLQRQIRQLAFNDPLTQLPNRRLLSDRLSQAMTASRRSACYGALIFLDLDNFKPLNDTHGHDVGDLLLIEVAHRLKTCVREVDTVARFGGDEFVVMLVDLNSDPLAAQAQASSVAEKIRMHLAEPYQLVVNRSGSHSIVEHHCSASIGVTLFIHHTGTQEAAIQRADAAMYQAKADGRNTVRFVLAPT